jgi:hypothetical protein
VRLENEPFVQIKTTPMGYLRTIASRDQNGLWNISGDQNLQIVGVSVEF